MGDGVVVLMTNKRMKLGDREVTAFWGDGTRTAFMWPEDGCWTVLWEDDRDSFPTEYDTREEAIADINEWIESEKEQKWN